MAKTIDDNLYAQIKDNDARKYQFEMFNTTNRVAGWKFYNADRVIDGDKTQQSDLVFMRATEMVLIKAEAKARLGQDASAEVNMILSARKSEDVTHEGFAAPASSTGTPVYGSTLDDIYLQWRIEMWGEGQGLIVLKRFKKTMVRGNNHAELKGASISYSDERFTFPIPNCETIENSKIN